MNKCRRRLRKQLDPTGQPKRRTDVRRSGRGALHRRYTWVAQNHLRLAQREGWSLATIADIGAWTAHFYQLRGLTYTLHRLVGQHAEPTRCRVAVRQLELEQRRRRDAERRYLDFIADKPDLDGNVFAVGDPRDLIE